MFKVIAYNHYTQKTLPHKDSTTSLISYAEVLIQKDREALKDLVLDHPNEIFRHYGVKKLSEKCSLNDLDFFIKGLLYDNDDQTRELHISAFLQIMKSTPHFKNEFREFVKTIPDNQIKDMASLLLEITPKNFAYDDLGIDENEALATLDDELHNLLAESDSFVLNVVLTNHLRDYHFILSKYQLESITRLLDGKVMDKDIELLRELCEEHEFLFTDSLSSIASINSQKAVETVIESIGYKYGDDIPTYTKSLLSSFIFSRFSDINLEKLLRHQNGNIRDMALQSLQKRYINED